MKTKYTDNLMRDAEVFDGKTYFTSLDNDQTPQESPTIMKQQTAMQELIDYINEFEYPVPEQILLKATELLKKEEEQIKQAHKQGIMSAEYPSMPEMSDIYFTKTYTQ